MKKFLIMLVGICFVCGCVTIPHGPVAIKMYADNFRRNDVAILRLQQRFGFYIFKCDGLPIFSNTQFVLIKPGRHDIWFRMQGMNLTQEYWYTNRKYMDAIGGHTYIIKTKGSGLFVVGNKWYPDVIDVTNDPKMNITVLPDYASTEVNTTNQITYENSKLVTPTMDEGINKK